MIFLNCPDCKSKPTIEPYNNTYMARCVNVNHDHIAMGGSIESVCKNWNRYIEFIITKDINVSSRYMNKLERVIFRGLYGIDNKEGLI